MPDVATLIEQAATIRSMDELRKALITLTGAHACGIRRAERRGQLLLRLEHSLKIPSEDFDAALQALVEKRKAITTPVGPAHFWLRCDHNHVGTEKHALIVGWTSDTPPFPAYSHKGGHAGLTAPALQASFETRAQRIPRKKDDLPTEGPDEVFKALAKYHSEAGISVVSFPIFDRHVHAKLEESSIISVELIWVNSAVTTAEDDLRSALLLAHLCVPRLHIRVEDGKEALAECLQLLNSTDPHEDNFVPGPVMDLLLPLVEVPAAQTQNKETALYKSLKNLSEAEKCKCKPLHLRDLYLLAWSAAGYSNTVDTAERFNWETFNCKHLAGGVFAVVSPEKQKLLSAFYAMFEALFLQKDGTTKNVLQEVSVVESGADGRPELRLSLDIDFASLKSAIQKKFKTPETVSGDMKNAVFEVVRLTEIASEAAGASTDRVFGIPHKGCRFDFEKNGNGKTNLVFRGTK